MNNILTATIIASLVTISASAEETKQQISEKNDKYITTQEYLAQPSQQPSMEKIEPAAGAVSNTKNPLLERKFHNFKR